MRRRPKQVGRARRLLTSSTSMVLLTACACGGYNECDPFGGSGGPPPESSRSLAFEDGRTYEKGIRRYDIVVDQSVTMHEPEDGAGRTSRLHVVLEERVASDGEDPVVDLTVVSAEATGEVTEVELDAARRRWVRLTGAGLRRKLEFPSHTLGDSETIRLIDLALLGHLMAPTAPKDGDRPVPESAPDGAHIYTGWDRGALDLTGRATVAEQAKVEGRRVVLLDASHEGRTTIASGEPAVTVCSYTRLPTVTGPLALAQRATVHRHTGLLLTSSGTGSIHFTGERSVPSAGVRAVRASTTRAPIAIDLDWRFEERLIGPWPSDPGPPWQRWLAIGLLAAVVVALASCLTMARSRLLPIRWRKRPDESDLAYVAAGWPR